MNLDALLEPIPEQVKRKEPCKVGRIINDLEAVYKTALIEMLERSYPDGGMTDEAIADRLKRAGLPVSPTVINRHRKGRCNCA